jgi:very-short-patch-repair endonuclease
MTERRTPFPSPLVGEGASRRLRREAGEGSAARNPSPGRSLRSRPPSPTRGEGKEPAVRSVDLSAAVKPDSTLHTRAATLKGHARELRANLTDAERKLWFALRDRRFADFKFRRQVPLGPFIADFVCFDARVVVEVDGGQHAESTKDARRDQWFAREGFLVSRYWNNDVLRNLEGVLTSLLETLLARTPHPDRAKRGRPSPTRGEGKERSARAEQTSKPAASSGGGHP